MMSTLAKHFSSRESMREVLRGRLRHAKCTRCACCICPRRVSHVVFLISLVLEQTSKDGIGNTEHSNVNVNGECNSK